MRPLVRRILPALAAVVTAVSALGAGICGDPTQEPEPTATPSATRVEINTPAALPPTNAALANPTIQPTVTAMPTSGPIDLPTPSSPAETMGLTGSVWVDARPVEGEVIASINGVECGKTLSLRPQSDPPDPIPGFTIAIASHQDKDGCGRPGDLVVVTINGRVVSGSIPWARGFQQPIDLVAGPPFMLLYGAIVIDTPYPGMHVTPFVNGNVCGKQVASLAGPLKWSYQLVVDPEELATGCGGEGATIELVLEAAGQSSIPLGSFGWSPSGSVRVPDVVIGQPEPSPQTTTETPQ